MRKIIGCVLAGGKSSRMGQNKALMIYKGLRLVDHMANILFDGGVENVIISGRISSGHQNIEDEIIDLGPIGGIISVLLSGEVKNSDLIVFTPVDMPLLKASLIRQLLDDKTSCFENCPLPFSLEVSEEITLLARQIKAERKPIAVKDFLGQLQVNYIKTNQENLVNINSQSDWEKL